MSISAVPSAASAATELDFHATLHHSAAYSTATGYSEYERVGTARELEVTVRHLHRLVGKRVSVFVNGHKVGTMLVNRYGNAHREWDTRHGQYVPWAGAGTPIRIRNAY